MAATPTLSKRGFTVREASTAFNDPQFIVEAFDSTLPFLASIGSGDMWGSISYSERPGFIEETAKSVKESEQYALIGSGEAVLILIAETELPDSKDSGLPSECRIRTDDSGRRFLAVGTAEIRQKPPSYIVEQEHLGFKHSEGEGINDLVYLEVVVADHRTGGPGKGAGTALINGAVEYGRKLGKRYLYVDSVSGRLRLLLSKPSYDPISHCYVLSKRRL